MHFPADAAFGDQRTGAGSAAPVGARRELPVLANGETSAIDRRDFLVLSGFAIAGASLAGCQPAPVRYAVPQFAPTEDFIPGLAYDYASTCGGCSAGCGVLIKSRDGRPIKLEGNPEHPLSRGGLCAVGQASLLGLYDQQRLVQPLSGNQPQEWQRLDLELIRRLETIRKERGAVRFLTGPAVGPTTRAVLGQFLGTFANARHVVHDPRTGSSILEAHARTHGARLLPHYHLDKAMVIVGFDADFLGGWIAPVEFTAAYHAGRRPDDVAGGPPKLSYHVQFESLLTLTGSKADERRSVAPGELAAVMNQLSARLAKKAGQRFPEGSTRDTPVTAAFLDHLAETLWQNRQKSLILCGSQDVTLQLQTNFLNHILGNYGTTVDVAQPSYQREDNDAELANLLKELHDGKIAALFVDGSNPVHDLPGGDRIAEDLKRVPLIVSFGPRLDETARLAHYVCPDHHFLESWGDAEPVNGIVSLRQPAINPLGNTRSVMESLSAWMGKPRAAYDLLRDYWEQEVFPRRAVPAGAIRPESTRELTSAAERAANLAAGQAGSPAIGHPANLPLAVGQAGRLATTSAAAFAAFWERTLHDGFAAVAPRKVKVESFNSAAGVVAQEGQAGGSAQESYSLVLYSKVGMPDSSHAYNPWLHELPDPISKVTWDNYASVSPATAAKLGLVDGDMVRVEAAGGQAGKAEPDEALELPVLVQPGQHDRVVGVALGYGSTLSRRFADIGPKWLQAGPTVGPNGMVGKNAAPLLHWAENGLRFTRDGVRMTKAAGQHPLATTQGYNLLTLPPRFTQEGRQRTPIIQETTLQAYQKDESGTKKDERQNGHASGPAGDLWPADHPVTGARWGMAIDLNACTGCSACVIACQAENNIPVVGKDEVRRQREMHWLRIDRYYTEHDRGVDVGHQPMLCQHCGNAPCEVVCPVLATVHSEEGLNQQVYNRCVGTRYCANNCPYKVRRFNWFDYAHEDSLQNLSLNPDVTVRSRGIMEKCTFCVQRIEEGKIAAGGHGLIPRDGAIQTACQQSCPAQAIVFGNLNDPTSRVARLADSRRSYQVLSELNVRPAVTYLGLVRNRPAQGEDVNKHG